MKETKELKWSREDTPIPKMGEVLTNFYHEQYKVIKVVKGNPDHTITLEKLN